MSDDTPTEAHPASGEHNANTAPAEAAGNQPESPKRASGDGRTGSGGGAPRRRRRRGSRGGRNRRKPAKTAAAPAGLGADGAAVSLDELDDTALERRRGRTRKGRPAGRYMMAVHVRDDRTTHIGVLEGRSLVEHYVGSLEPDDTAIDGNIYLG